MALEPLRVTSATWAPEERPSWALGLLVVTRNSAMESWVVRRTLVKA